LAISSNACPRHNTFCTAVVVISHHQTSTGSGADQWQLLPVPISATLFRLAPTPTLLRHRQLPLRRSDRTGRVLSAKSGAIVAPEAEHVHLVVLIQFFENDA
jgi:hypothetical protein